MTSEELKRLKDICEKATPGPWQVVRWNDDSHIKEVNDSTGWLKKYPESYIACIGGWGYVTDDNKTFIAEARTALPKLIQEVERLREALEAADNLMHEIYPKSVFAANPLSDDDDRGVQLVKRYYKAREALGAQRSAGSSEMTRLTKDRLEEIRAILKIVDSSEFWLAARDLLDEIDALEAENKNLRYLKEQYFQSDLAVREQRNQLRERVVKLRKALKRVSKASDYGWEARICAEALATDDEMGDE